jgi:hypothetical protein
MRIVNPETGRACVEKRRQRFHEPGQPRALTFSCYRRLPFLMRDQVREWLRDALLAACLEFDFQIWAYVVMPEHLHLLVYPGDHPDWEWSSAGWFAGIRPVKIEMDDMVLKELARDGDLTTILKRKGVGVIIE